LAGLATEDLSQDFAVLIAAKDESALQAQQRAIGMVEEGYHLLAGQVEAGKDLWEIAAQVDYRLRMAGCEDTNILLGSAAGRGTRPGYPTHYHPRRGDKLSAYIAVIYGRQWAAAGRTLNVGPADTGLDDLLEKIAGVQENVQPSSRPA
jgi:Xaa-Pro aminopeptidase